MLKKVISYPSNKIAGVALQPADLMTLALPSIANISHPGGPFFGFPIRFCCKDSTYLQVPGFW